MNILHLKYALEIAKTGSINKAAENLYIGQPNLSRAIKELESTLGITIFSRSAKGMTTTVEGEEFLGYAKKILAQIDDVELMYTNMTPKIQRFSVSVPRASYITEAFTAFTIKLDKTKNIEMFYMETNASRAIKNITDSEYNLGIIRYAANYEDKFHNMLDDKGINYELITEFHYVLAMNKNHPLANKEEIRFSDLTPYTELAHGDPFVPSLSQNLVRKEELPTDIKRRIFVFERASQFDLLAKNTDVFMWVSPLPDDCKELLGLVQRECVDNKRIYRDELIYKNDYQLSKLDSDFITEVCNSRRKYIKQS